MKTRPVLVFVLFAFAITLALVVGWRMSAEAMAVVIGVIAGVAASIPTSLIVIWFMARAKLNSTPAPTRREPEPNEPRIIVVNAPPAAPSNYPTATPSPYALNEPQRTPRRFTIIGGGEEENL